MNKKPLVTVYIPTFNRLELLKRAVNSVLDQDYTNIELIVVDDGSSDDTVDYLNSISKHDSRVRYFVNEINSGACISRNKAIWAANGDFITGLDDDDMFLPERITQLTNSWKLEEGIQALYTDARIKYSQNKIKTTNRPSEVTLEKLAVSNYIGNQIFCPTEYLREIKAFNPELKIWQDLDCWIRLLSSESSKARKVGHATYVVDKSHAHESITKNNRDKVFESYKHIIHGAQMDKKNAARLKAQLYLSCPNHLRLAELIHIIIRAKSFISASKLIRAFTKNKINATCKVLKRIVHDHSKTKPSSN